MTSKRSLCKVKGLSEAKVDKIKEAAVKLLDCGFVSALEYSVKREAVFKITTGCDELDKLMGGGLQSMSITEAFGNSGRVKPSLVTRSVLHASYRMSKDKEGVKRRLLTLREHSVQIV